MKRLLFGLLLCLPVAGLSAAEWRTFTDYKGRKMEAKILRVENEVVIVELKSNGRQLPIDFEDLSEEDVDFLSGYEDSGSSSSKSKNNKSSDDSPSDSEDDDPALEGSVEGNRLYPHTKDEIRKTIREIEHRSKPDDISKPVHQATQKLNVYRFLCGVPFNVEANAGFSRDAEAAALACQKNGGLSHKIGSSTDKCNLSSSGDVVNSVTRYIEDSGANNRDARGHRAWCLNPPMGEVGFGAGDGRYSAMWCMDRSGKSIRDSWSYPGKGLFPLEYMHGNAWSLYGAGQPNSPESVKIKIWKLFKRPERPFSATAEIPGREIKVNHVSMAMNGINFEPEDPAKRGVYWISVRGGGIRESYLVELY